MVETVADIEVILIGFDSPARRGQSYVGQYVTLDGNRAIVSGRSKPFATIATLPNGPAYEFAWETVAHIIETREGRFTS